MNEFTTADTIFKVVGGGFIAMGAWAMKLVHKNLASRLSAHDKRIREIETSDCAEVFERKLERQREESRAETNELRKETQASVTRLHDKLDTCVQDLTKNQNEQTNRIIALIQNQNHGH